MNNVAIVGHTVSRIRADPTDNTLKARTVPLRHMVSVDRMVRAMDRPAVEADRAVGMIGALFAVRASQPVRAIAWKSPPRPKK